MKVERVLVAVAFGCAVLLLIAPLTPRTSWSAGPTSETRGGGGMTHSAGWDWFAPAMGIVAIISLVTGAWSRPRVVPSVVSSAVAAAAFAVAGAAALGHWLDLRSGSLDINGWTIYHAPAVGYAAAIAGTGMMVTLVVTGSWLHPGDVEW